jgi:putative glutamine amidotransferase
VSRPVIGICAAIEQARWRAWSALADVLPRSYSNAIQTAGGMAVMLPADDATAERPEELLGLLDGLILAGGTDVDPASYGARPHPETGDTRPERDRFELALAHLALEEDMPLLAICRGMELLNVACGGTLEQHLERLDVHRHTPGQFSDHEVRLEPGSLAARASGGERVSVRSTHHQGLDELGEGLVASGWSEPDGLIEAVEHPGRSFALGVLWHPEEDSGSGILSSFVDAVRSEVGAR